MATLITVGGSGRGYTSNAGSGYQGIVIVRFTKSQITTQNSGFMSFM